MLNENIKNLRNAKGLSQEELANELNIVRQTIPSVDKSIQGFKPRIKRHSCDSLHCNTSSIAAVVFLALPFSSGLKTL